MRLQLAILTGSVLFASAALSCKDESGRPVDWFNALKHNNGFVYSYLDSNSPSSLKKSDYTLDQTQDGSIVLTLAQIYESSKLFFNHSDQSVFVDNTTKLGSYSMERNNVTFLNSSLSDIAYAFYNDEQPDGSTTTYYAHSKAVMAFDGTSGFWLTHSMPKWPNRPADGYDILPDKTYGQSFICITFSSSEFDTIGTQMQINRPWVYDSNLPDSLAGKAPGFSDWINDAHKSGQTAVTLKSKGGASFKHMAKSKDLNLDLYYDLVAPSLDSDLVAETWQNGGGNLGPFCKGGKYDYTVTDVQDLSVNGDEWDTNQDHSKWAISLGSKRWVCIGDMNRQGSQEKRGGGTICQDHTTVHSAFTAIIQNSEQC